LSRKNGPTLWCMPTGGSTVIVKKVFRRSF
jgi:hypothetical protein